MKKHLTILSYAVMMFMAFTASFTLTSCGEEVSIDGPGSSEEGMTVFSSVSDGTRTTIDNDGVFYWQSETNSGGVTTKDQIWVDPSGNETGSSFTLDSKSSEFTDNNRTGKFFFSQQLTANKYSLSYTGFGSTSGTQVTIASSQTQLAWSDASHIGKSGDCATATATKGTDGNYTFTLEHKSSYLIFKPYAPNATTSNPYTITEIEITDLDGNALSGTFPLTYDGLQTNGASNTSNVVRIAFDATKTFTLPTAASDAYTAYAVILPGNHANLRVGYKVKSSQDGTSGFTVYDNIGGTYAPNGARIVEAKITKPIDPDPSLDPIFDQAGNGKFGGVKFAPAYFYRTDGTATTNATLQLKTMKDDPFILLQHNQPGSGNTGSAITEQNRRMFFTWNELVEIFGHVTTAGQGASWQTTAPATNGHITKTKAISGKNYRLPTSGEYSKLIETPNSGRATVNYYPASFAAVRVDLSGSATYSDKGWSHTAAYNASVPADYIMGYLFFPDNMVVRSSKLSAISLNGRWNNQPAQFTPEYLQHFLDNGCIFLPAAGNSDGSGWYNRGTDGYYWSGTINVSNPGQAGRFGFLSSTLNVVSNNRTLYFAAVPVEN